MTVRRSALSNSSTNFVRVKLVVQYDGTDFRGWATQSDQRTVQSTLKEAVRRISGEEVEIVGASRTDSGAHARGQVCHFDTQTPVPIVRWPVALNRLLERDIVVASATQVANTFHSRFSALDRFYRYRIDLASPRNPFNARFVHHYGRPLNLDAMKNAAEILTGKHDFRAFTEELDDHIVNTVRHLFSIQVKQTRSEVWVDVVGTAFLRGMMRRISGALLEVGRGARPVEEVSRLLSEERNQYQWPVVLPARGLCLMRVKYGRREFDNRHTASFEDDGPAFA